MGFALLAHIYTDSKGRKQGSIWDFAPHEAPPVATIDDVIAAFGTFDNEAGGFTKTG